MPPLAVPPFARSLLSLCLAAVCVSAWADEYDPPAEPVSLKPSTNLTLRLSKDQTEDVPTFIEADRIGGHIDAEMIAEGRVILRNLRERVESDWLRYDKPEDRVRAYGNVVMDQHRDHIEGGRLDLLMTDRIGQMRSARYEIYGDGTMPSRGTAETLHFKGEKIYQLEKSIYTTCPLDDPDWVMRSDSMELNYITSLGSGRHVTVEYQGVPVIYTPWMDFSLDDKRKSGFLTPSFGFGKTTGQATAGTTASGAGLDFTIPWYWNIAPNRDATITPHYMGDRGLQVGVEFRYLEPTYRGGLVVEMLPGDKLANRSRDHEYIKHSQSLGPNWSFSVDAERVSDSAFFTDLSTMVQNTSKVHLVRQVDASYSKGLWLASTRIQRFQTLQDASNSIVQPYQRVPQITLSRLPSALWSGGPGWSMDGDYSRFAHRQNLRADGSRAYIYPSVHWTHRNQYLEVTPKVGMHMTRYALDGASRYRSDASGVSFASGFPDSERNLPIFSLSGSLFMEREWNFLSRDFLHTLEPRAYYVYIPKKDQSRIPVFDSGASDISMDQIFTENRYSSVDRVNDANQLTLAVTSRFIEQDVGAERLQLTLARRFYFTPQYVALPNETLRTSTRSDILATASGQVTRKLSFSAGMQYADNTTTLAKFNTGAVWRDGPGRAINADYRFNKGSIKQFDTSWQWPIMSRWSALGRVNYLVKEGRMAEGLLGLEYNAGCWSLRGVVHTLVTSATLSTNTFFVQLELRGLTKLGSNPLDVLKRSISGYVKSDEIENLP
ncbi:MAG: LPS-assembly protein LptD [Betaproteobacteria bacterium]|nr:LPS-assembly protein LptD [Betaproteobacteria bacterium]